MGYFSCIFDVTVGINPVRLTRINTVFNMKGYYIVSLICSVYKVESI